MTLQIGHAGVDGFLNKLLIQLIVAGAEGDVHAGTGSLLCSTLVKIGRIQIVIQHAAAEIRILCHRFQTAHLLDPFGDQLHHVDGVRRRRVVHAVFVSHQLVIQQNRHVLAVVTHEILANDDNCHTCRAHVLLCAGINHTILGNVDRLGQNVGGHVSNNRNISCVRVIVPFGTEDGVVCADVEVICIRADVQLIRGRNPMSVMEMSHRSKYYDDIINGAQDVLRRVYNIPDNYRILFQFLALFQFKHSLLFCLFSLAAFLFAFLLVLFLL